MSFESGIQGAIYAKLTGNAPLMALVAAVYDDVPQPSDSGNGAAFPYVTIGEDVAVEWDTDTDTGADVTMTIHSWSIVPGRKQIKQIQGAIYDALHRAVVIVTGYKVVGVDWVSSQSFIDADGVTRHGVQIFRITLEL